MSGVRTSGGAGGTGLGDGAVEWRRAVAAASVVDVRAMFDEGLDGGGAAEANSVMESGHAVLIGGVDVDATAESFDDALTLVGWIGIALGADGEEGVGHGAATVRRGRVERT